MDLQDTIVAISSPHAPAARGIVRLSGEDTFAILERMFQADVDPSGLVDDASKHRSLELPSTASHRVGRCELRVPGSALDAKTVPGDCFLWPGTRSYTGQPAAELHLVGALPILDAVVETAIQHGARLARPGEFTLRAVIAGKLDLIQAEAVLGVIEAGTPEELHVALRQLAGNLSNPVRQLRDELVEVLAHLEAGLDFVEEDIEFIAPEQLIAQLESIEGRLAALAAQIESRGQRGRPPRVVLVGRPNAGKSSVYNALAGQSSAIVSSLAGTTRDALSQLIDCGGITIECVDTAGLEELDDDTPRAIAQHHVQKQLKQADWILFCVDATDVPPIDWLADQFNDLRHAASVALLWTKVDLLAGAPRVALNGLPLEQQWEVSIRWPQSIAALRENLREGLSMLQQPVRGGILEQTLVRCRSEINTACQCLADAIRSARDEAEHELIAADLRWTIESLSGVIGEVHSEDILDNIFGRFCIGK